MLWTPRDLALTGRMDDLESEASGKYNHEHRSIPA